MTVTTTRGLWKTYSTWAYFATGLLVVFLLWQYPRTFSGFFRGWKGGSAAGLLLAYTGSILLVLAQLYTFVKRVGNPFWIRSLGGARLWLTIHIVLSFAGLVAVLLHAGFPYRFNSGFLFDQGFAGLATWLLIISSASGVFGRYVYGKLPAMRRLFGYWKPAHVFITALLYMSALAHMLVQI